MKVRIVAAALLCAVMAAGLLTGCGETSAKESIRLVIKTPPLEVTNGSDSEIEEACELLAKAGEDFSSQYEAADVTVDVVKFEYQEEEKNIKECFDTEDAADILFEGYFNMLSYVYTGRAVPLDDVLPEEAAADFAPAIYEAGQVDGRTYMLPSYSFQNTLAYNKELFKQCGLDSYIGKSGTIDNWSPEDWEYILDTLAAGLPDTTYPLMMYGKTNQGDTHIMTLIRSRGCTFFDKDNNLCVNTPEGIEALRWIQGGVERGWYPDDSENLTIDDCMALFDSDRLAICLTNNVYYGNYDPDKIGLVNFPSEKGDGFSTEFISGFMMFDNDDEARLKAAKDFIRFFYGNDEYLDYEAAGIPSNTSVLERMKDKVTMPDAYVKNRHTQWNFTGNNPNWRGDETSVRAVFWPHIHNLLAGEITPEECAANIDRDCNQAIELGRETGVLHE